MTYVAVDVGCMECGEDTRLLGVYEIREAAERACKDAAYLQSLDWVGQHAFLVLDTENPDDYSPFSGHENAERA